MKTFCRLAASLVSLATLIGPAMCDPVPTYRVAASVAHDNLSVYFVRGNGSGGAAPLTLDEAVKSGEAKVRLHDNRPFTVENFSDRSVFIPFGTLLVGGLQDQVTATSLLVPPHSGPIPLATFCVDPFRSTPRDNEDPTRLTTGDTAFPSRIGSLAMLTGAAHLGAVSNIRQASVWWSIDSTRAALSHALGVALEPPYRSHWETSGYQDYIANPVLAERQSPWTTSLPQALDNHALRNAEQAFAEPMDETANGDDVIGAVFAINGSIEDAEIYQSHALFAAMWPKLLRAHAVAATAAGSEVAQVPVTGETAVDDARVGAPTVAAVNAFLAAAEAGTMRAQSRSGALVRDSDAAIFTETRAHNGTWVNRSFVSTAIPSYAAASPEAALLAMLKSGMVEGRSVAALGDRDYVVLHRADGGWSATVRMPPDDVLRQLGELISAGIGTHTDANGNSLIGAAITLAFFALLFRLLMPQRARRRVVAARYSAGHSRIAVADCHPSHPAVAWCVAPARIPASPPARVSRRRPRLAMTMKAFAAILMARAARFWRAVVTAKGLAGVLAQRLGAAWAAWPPDRFVVTIARQLGPAWPGNFGAPSRKIAVPTRR